MKPVDMQDLKSCGHRPCGFDSRPEYQKRRYEKGILCYSIIGFIPFL